MRVLTPQPSHLWSFGPENRRDEHVHVDFLCRIHTDPILLGQVHPDSLYNQESHKKRDSCQGRRGLCTLEVKSVLPQAETTKLWLAFVGHPFPGLELYQTA